jgi:hypothetical protein
MHVFLEDSTNDHSMIFFLVGKAFRGSSPDNIWVGQFTMEFEFFVQLRFS